MMLFIILLVLAAFVSPALRPDAYPLRISFDFELLKSKQDNVTFDDINYVASQSSSYISEIVSTYPRTFSILAGDTCGGQALASNISANYADIDLLVLVTTEDLGANTNAIGTTCKYDSAYINRPVLGLLTLNNRM